METSVASHGAVLRMPCESSISAQRLVDLIYTSGDWCRFRSPGLFNDLLTSRCRIINISYKKDEAPILSFQYGTDEDVRLRLRRA